MLKELVTICEKIIMQASLGGVDSKLLNCDPRTNSNAPRGVQSLKFKYIRNMFLNILPNNYTATMCETTKQVS